jgi:hypothetical protein
VNAINRSFYLGRLKSYALLFAGIIWLFATNPARAEGESAKILNLAKKLFEVPSDPKVTPSQKTVIPENLQTEIRALQRSRLDRWLAFF